MAIIWPQGLVGQRSLIKIYKNHYFRIRWHFFHIQIVCSLMYHVCSNDRQLSLSLRANVFPQLQRVDVTDLVLEEPRFLESGCSVQSWLRFWPGSPLPQKMTNCPLGSLKQQFSAELPEVNNPHQVLHPVRFWWCHHCPREDIGFVPWLPTGNQRVTFPSLVCSQEKNSYMAIS